MSPGNKKHKSFSQPPSRLSQSDPSSCWSVVGRFNYPTDVSLGPNGTLFVVDVNSLRRVSMPELPTTVLGVGFDGRVSTVAGGAGPGETDGTGPEVSALISPPLSHRLSTVEPAPPTPLFQCSLSRQLPPPLPRPGLVGRIWQEPPFFLKKSLENATERVEMKTPRALENTPSCKHLEDLTAPPPMTPFITVTTLWKTVSMCDWDQVLLYNVQSMNQAHIDAYDTIITAGSLIHPIASLFSAQ